MLEFPITQSVYPDTDKCPCCGKSLKDNKILLEFGMELNSNLWHDDVVKPKDSVYLKINDIDIIKGSDKFEIFVCSKSCLRKFFNKLIGLL